MEQPNYILKTFQSDLVPVKPKQGFIFLKIGVWIVVAILVFGSLFFRDNLFMELSGTTRILLIALAIGVSFAGNKKDYAPSPLELRFYDDYIVFYLEKKYYSKRVTKMEFIQMKYAEISKCEFDTRNQMVYVHGDGIAKLYKYNKDGTLPSEPTDVRNAKGGLMYFGTRFMKDIDIKKEIEEHSPIKVITMQSWC